MAVNTAELEDAVRVELGRRHSKETTLLYAGIARQLAKHTGKTHSFKRRDVLLFIDSLIDSGKSSRYINWVYYPLKAIFRAIEEPCPITIEDFPPITGEINQPTMTQDRVKSAIIKTNRHSLPHERFYLLMSTVYGLRRIELARLERSSFDDVVRHVTIDTAKGGKPRVHVIPDSLQPIIRECLNGKLHLYSSDTLSVIFWDICSKAGCHRSKGEGWHSIRRALNTGLKSADVNSSYIRNFMRWKPPRGDMSELYFHEVPAKVDRVIFEKHPFLAAWSV